MARIRFFDNFISNLNICNKNNLKSYKKDSSEKGAEDFTSLHPKITLEGESTISGRNVHN